MIGIIAAMDQEISELRDIMHEESSHDVSIGIHSGMTFIRGVMYGRDVVMVKCGIGKVNAAVAAEIMCIVYNVDMIINTGVAGSLDAEINIGDIVLSTSAMYHDMDVTALGYKRGEIPDQEESVFSADEDLRMIAHNICTRDIPEIGVFEGMVVSGDQFVSGGKVREGVMSAARNYESFGKALCCEMEGAAIAQVAWLNSVPYLIVRAISDKADNSAEMDYPEFQKQAIRHTVTLMTGLVKEIDE